MINPIKSVKNEWKQVGIDRELLESMPGSTSEQRVRKQRVLEATRRRDWGEPIEVPLVIEARTAIRMELIELGGEYFLVDSFSTTDYIIF